MDTPAQRSNTAEDFLNPDLAPRHDRVREHTPAAVNERLDRLARANVQAVLQHGAPAVRERMVELDQEWDIDRAMIVNFAVVGGAAFSSGLARYATTPWYRPRRKGFLYFFGAQLGFLLLHGAVGWCPPAALFRRLGFRTKAEIEAERLLLLRTLDAQRENA